MKKFLTLLMLSLTLLSLVACKNTEVTVDVWPDKETIDTFVDEKVEPAIADTVISGAVIFEDAKDVVETTTQSMDTMLVDMTNSQLESYTGEKVRGATVLNFIKKIGDLSTAEILPIPLSFEYKDGLSEDTLASNKYYKVEIFDTLPEGNVDGFFDLAVISKFEEESSSGE